LRVKRSLLILFLFSGFVHAWSQDNNLEVLLIGAAHEYKPKSNQDLTNVHQKIRAFQPQAFFGEWLSKEDEKALKSYALKGWVIRRTELLKSKNDFSGKDLSKEIIHLEKLVENEPNNLKYAIDLAIVYYLDSDQGNGYFQMWKVAKHLQKNPADTVVFNYACLKFFSDVIDNVDKAVRPYIHDEYDYIAHPMMQEMGMKKIYPIDSQRWDGQGSDTWRKPDSILKHFIEFYSRDSLTEIGKRTMAIHKEFNMKMKSLETEANQIYGENHFTEALNGPQLTERMFQTAMIPEAYKELDFFPTELYDKKYNSWLQRNYDMCENTIRQAQINNFERVVIVVGANHAKIMADLFKERGVKVRNINE
jgi:hypothetical protein